MTFEVRNEELEKLLQELGNYLKSAVPKGYGFTLLISNYGAGGNLFYISSVDRSDTLRMLQEFIDKHKLEGAPRQLNYETGQRKT